MAERLDVQRLAKKRSCPRCDLDKTLGTGLCRKCRSKLPPHMRTNLESIDKRNPHEVMVAMKRAASFFRQHFRSVRHFGGGQKHS